MNEQDFKYLIASYQQKSFDLFSQSVANDAKIRQLSELVDALTKKINEQQEELDNLNSKPKRNNSKSQSEDFA